MAKDLTTSRVDRQNILNNELALQEIQVSSNIKGILYEGKICLTKNMVAAFFDVEPRTIERYVSDNADELMNNGYEILRGQRLKSFIQCVREQDVPDINVGNISNRTPQLAIFDFRSFLNIAMLLTESENARVLRQLILDIVIDLVNQKTGGGTKYINQRDKDFISTYLQEENYRREFTDALRDYVDMGNAKYAIYTDKIYQSIFKEKAREYREILRLKKNDKVRDTLYSEVLNLVASYECGLAALLKEQSEQLGRKLNNWETDDVFRAFEQLPLWKPLVHSARVKMASRDLALRDAFHQHLEEYIQPLESEEYHRFLGAEGDEIERLMIENEAVLKRLKERE
ncbi:MAG: DNA-binding protein [Oscillospiraceae bacterium]|nr:DNA-binding protein [Oscillospiraceae bacterium]